MPKRISVKGLQKKLEHLNRDYLKKIRGDKCELCKENKAVVADHCFSRKVRQLFFDRRNLTVLCGGCHFKKTHRINCVDLQIYELVKSREGEPAFFEMFKVSRYHKPFPEFSKRWYLEEIQEQLKKITVIS